MANKNITFTEEQKRELIALRVDKNYGLDQMIQHARQVMNIDIRNRETMKRRLAEWQKELNVCIAEQIEEKKIETGMTQLQRISDWSQFRSLVRDRFIAKLQSGDDIRFGELADALCKADSKLAELLGLKDKGEEGKALEADFAVLFGRIREARKIDVAQEVDCETVG